MVLLHSEFGEPFQDPPRNLFLSHSLVFTSFLIWYNHCQSGPLQFRSCVLGSIPPSSKGSHTSQPNSGISGSWPEETSPEDSWDVMIMTLKDHNSFFLCREIWASQCQYLASRAIKASPSWVCLQPLLPTIHLHVLFWSLSWFSETPCLTTL